MLIEMPPPHPVEESTNEGCRINKSRMSIGFKSILYRTYFRYVNLTHVYFHKYGIRIICSKGDFSFFSFLYSTEILVQRLSYPLPRRVGLYSFRIFDSFRFSLNCGLVYVASFSKKILPAFFRFNKHGFGPRMRY